VASKVANREDIEGLPPIKVVGVGGAGCNAVNRMIEAGVKGVQFVGVNTDTQALMRCDAESRLRVGERLTKGLGVGGDADKGQRAAEESRDEILDTVRGSEMVFITAGMGGGTGTGAAPIVAEAAKEAGALTIAVVTKPFSFEGSRRRLQAENGICMMRDRVDTLIIIPNDRLLSICDQKTSLAEAFRVADDILRQGIQGIAELITTPGDINLDFADVRRIMNEAGPALMAIGRASGENRAVDAARAAITSPLLDVSIHGARGVLFNFTAAKNLGLHELNMAAQVIAEVVDPDAEIIFGTATDPEMGDEVQVTLIAVGFATPELYEEPTREERLRQLRDESLEPSIVDTELPSFLRRPVVTR
jgi:cell division protein FtsZ